MSAPLGTTRQGSRPRSTQRSAVALAQSVSHLSLGVCVTAQTGRSDDPHTTARYSATMEQATRQWLGANRSKANRTAYNGKRNYTTADRRKVLPPVFNDQPGHTLDRAHGLAVGTRLHGTNGRRKAVVK